MIKYQDILKRQMPLVSQEEQDKFKNSKIAVVGCGGIGGAATEMLARMGVGELILIDEDSFDVSNLNRQVLSSVDNLNKVKAEVAEERVNKINPNVKVTKHITKLDENNVDKLLKNADIIVDALDNVLARVIISRYAKNNKIPFIHGAIHGMMGQITVFKEKIDYETLFNLASKDKDLTEDVLKELDSLSGEIPPAIGPTPNIIGALEAIEAFKLITGIGTITEAPNMLNFDLLNFNSFMVEEF